MSLHENKPTVLILGGYGKFGSLIATALVAQFQLKLIIAGRSLEKAALFANKIKRDYPQAHIQAMALDRLAQDFCQKLEQCNLQILIHCAGPFQGQDYKVAQTCIDLNINYIDLSDGRDFVTHITQLDEKAKEKGVCVISGAGSVPGISCAVVDLFAKKFAILREVEFGIAPANKIALGDAAITAILGYMGKPFLRLEQGKWKMVHGWQNLHQHYYGDNLGLRWQANGDIPDLTLLPLRYPTLTTVIYHAGLEVPVLHFILWFMSWLTRSKIVKNWAVYHKMITAISATFRKFGTEKGGMYVRLSGSSMRYQPLEINWNLVSEQKHGVYIAIIPCLILVKKIIQGLVSSGAKPCLGLFTLEEFEGMLSHWSIYTTVEELES